MTSTTEPPQRDKRYCGVAKRQSEGTCTRPAGWGTKHPGIGACKLHGGSTQSHLIAAQRDMAASAVVTYGLPRDIDPQSALLEEVHRTAGHVAWLGAVVSGIKRKELVWGVSETVDKQSSEFPGTDTTRAARPSVWLSLYQAERKHLTEVCRVAISAGIEERRVRLAESQGALLAGVIERVLRRLDLSPAQQVLVGEVVPQELRAAAEIEAGVIGA